MIIPLLVFCVVGLAFVHGERVSPATFPPATAQISDSRPAGHTGYVPVILTNDEASLMDMGTEPAAYAHMPEPLQALDGLTPRARDYVAPR